MASFEDASEYAGFDKRTPSPQDVTSFHTNSDKDSSVYAQHHTLGKKPTQAAAGDHKHDDLYLPVDYTEPLLPKLLAVATAATAIPAGGWAILDALGAIYNVGGFGFISADTIVIPVAGVYRLTSTLYFDSTTAGYRASRFIVDGVTQEYVSNYQSGAGSFISVFNSINVELDVNSEVSIQGGAQTAMNLRGASSGLGLSRIELEFVQ